MPRTLRVPLGGDESVAWPSWQSGAQRSGARARHTRGPARRPPNSTSRRPGRTGRWTRGTNAAHLGHPARRDGKPRRWPPAELIPDPAALKQLKLLWLSVGNRDNLLRVSKGLHDYLTEKGVPHIWRVDTNGHDTGAMTNSLYHFAQKLFKD